jgi:hypothetical protein
MRRAFPHAHCQNLQSLAPHHRTGPFPPFPLNGTSRELIARPDCPSSPEFAKKYEGKGEKVELEEAGQKTVVVKLITEEANAP